MRNVSPKLETVSLKGSGDVADDPAIWIHPDDPALSAVIGTNKDKTDGGLVVFDLNGDIMLQPSEAQAAVERFRRIADANGDGRVTRQEYRAAREHILAQY